MREIFKQQNKRHNPENVKRNKFFVKSFSANLQQMNGENEERHENNCCVDYGDLEKLCKRVKKKKER